MIAVALSGLTAFLSAGCSHAHTATPAHPFRRHPPTSSLHAPPKMSVFAPCTCWQHSESVYLHAMTSQFVSLGFFSLLHQFCFQTALRHCGSRDVVGVVCHENACCHSVYSFGKNLVTQLLRNSEAGELPFVGCPWLHVPWLRTHCAAEYHPVYIKRVPVTNHVSRPHSSVPAGGQIMRNSWCVDVLDILQPSCESIKHIGERSWNFTLSISSSKMQRKITVCCTTTSKG